MTQKKKTVRKPVVDPLALRAQQATDLRYGPEVSALRQLGTDARESYLAGSGQARAAANSIVAATNESAGGLADFLARAGQRGGETMARIGPVSGALSNEGQLAARNHGLDVQSVAASLAQAKVRAQQAGNYQTQRLYSQYQTDANKINQQGSALAGQAGQYAQSVYQSLLDDKSKSDLEAKKIAATARNAMLGRATSRLVAGIDVNGKVIPGSAVDAKLDADAAKATAAAADKATAAKEKKDKARSDAAAKKWLTQGEQNAYISNIKTVAGMIKNQLNATVPPDLVKKNAKGEIVDTRPAIVLPNGKALKAGSKFTTSQMRMLLTTSTNPLGKAFDKDTINAAMDLAVLGYLSPANVKQTHLAGVKITGRLPTGRGRKPNPLAGVSGGGTAGMGARGTR